MVFIMRLNIRLVGGVQTSAKVAWGNEKYGGDCGAVQEQLRNVLKIQAACYAFAAVLEVLDNVGKNVFQVVLRIEQRLAVSVRLY